MATPHFLKHAALLLASVTALAAAQSIDLASEGKAWWAHVQFLADDKLEGRNAGTAGYEKAVDYEPRLGRPIQLAARADGAVLSSQQHGWRRATRAERLSVR